MALFHFGSNAQQMHTDSNAVSIASESNTTTGWGGGAIKSVDSSDPYHGSYAMKLTSTTGATGRYTTYSFNAMVGDVYDISIWVKPGSQTQDPGFTGWSGLSGFSVTWITGTQWEEYTFTVTATSTTPEIRVYTGIASGSTGDILYVDSVSIQKQGQNLHAHSNAASIANESDSVSGWTGGSEESTTSTDVYSGNYSLKFTALGEGYYYSAYTFNTTPNEQYVVSLYAKHASTTNPGIYWNSVVENQEIPITSTSWSQYSKTVTATGSTIRILVYSGAPAVTNDAVFIDNVSITPVGSTDTQAPTAPTLTSTANTDTTLDLSWSGSTDDTGVTAYKVYKDGVLESTLGNMSSYQVSSLTASTTYNMTVTALDAANNESSVSNTVSVTTDAPSGGGTTFVWDETGGVASYMGDVAIGRSTVPAGYSLVVEGKIRTREVRVDQDTWADYVFKSDYYLHSLDEIQEFILENGHLPNIPSAEEVKLTGIELGEMNKLLLEKIEELTLHLIEQQQQLRKQQLEIETLKVQLRKTK